MAFPWSVSALVPLLTDQQKLFFLQDMAVAPIPHIDQITHIDINGFDLWYVSYQKGKREGQYNCITASIHKEVGCKPNAINLPMVIDHMVLLFNQWFPNEVPPPGSQTHCISLSYLGLYLLGPTRLTSSVQELKQFVQTHTSCSYPQGGCTTLLYFLSDAENVDAD
jgi:hypothetical protein